MPRQKNPSKIKGKSDAFEEKDGDLELRVHVIDISYDETNPILQTCEPLYGYSYLVHRAQWHKHQGDDDDTAIAKAIDDCLGAGILTDFLRKNGKEVMKLFKLQWNEKDAQKYWKEEGEATTWVASARNLMRTMKLTAQQAVEAIAVPPPLRERVLQQLG